MAEANTISCLVVGKTGVGKTSFINSAAGSEIAEEGDELEIGTFHTEKYEITHETSGTTIRFWDTPGLFDMTKRSDLYMEKIREKYDECDLVMYCSDMTDTRITEQDKRTIHEFTKSLGSSFWRRTCFILTFGNYVENPRSKTTAEYFMDTQKRLKAAYSKVLKEACVSADVVDNIPFVPAGYHPWSPDKEMYILLDGKNWISTFWMACFARGKDARHLPRDAPPKIASRDQCTFNKHERNYVKQDWFECYTCWGGNSSFGCCHACALDCHRGHQLVKHHPNSSFFCDCGTNKHQPAVCTYNSTSSYKLQPFYRCRSCFSKDSEGVCHQCSINCHRGHDLKYAGEISAYCDCGLDCCRVSCRIAKPK